LTSLEIPTLSWYVKFVDEFPLTATGKVQKFKLKEIAIDELEQNN
jgi:fatty-acyl-CoA synthase